MAEPHSIDSLSDDAFGWYFTGLADGEAYFGLSPSLNRRKPPFLPRWRAAFVLLMRGDETENIKALARRMGCGHTYHRKAEMGRVKSQPGFVWNVNKSADLAEIIIPHFARFPLQFKKARDFQIWKQAIPILVVAAKRSRRQRKNTLTSQERAFLVALNAQLKAVRRYASPETENVVPNAILPPPEEEYPLFPDH